MAQDIDKYKSRKSKTTYIVSIEDGKTYLTVEGEMSTNRDVIKQIENVSSNNYDVSTTAWIARQLANSF